MIFTPTQMGALFADDNGFRIQLDKQYIPALMGLDGYSQCTSMSRP